MMADLSDCNSFDDIVSTMRDFIKKRNITEKGVALGWGYDHNFLPGERHPDKDVLDQVSE